MVISFLGHRFLCAHEKLVERVEKAIIESLMDCNDDNIVFLCGGYGDFDNLCARVCRSVKENWKKSEIVFVTPYITVAQQEKMKAWIGLGVYDSTVYPPLEKVPLKFAIKKRNEWMIDQSDFIIAYVEHSYGGAYQSLNYARRKKKRIVNLAE